jgi:mono/diheme cytochrome c family protein
MRKRIWVVAVLVVAVFPFSPNLSRAQQSNSEPRERKVEAARVKEIYRRDCLVCHGANGDGKTDILRDRELSLPDWTDPKSLGGRVDQQLFNVIRFGRGKMPAESAGRADDAEVRDLVRYIRTMARDEAAVMPVSEAVGSDKH